ncbi:GGDEF domain-containing protein [Pseudoalteromonas sp. MMG010]|uniref:GGDEF domain-containing protein n=1 Tax=Pseudoalteromonas sp. MMG010 TaxID=2822685 RepID=UPI001B39D4E1|nr:GGDEF domain-containing protein [Pseudoalteromonas sp. MMG010]MBQ4832675.1 GGDEF domain-containing protein [Pseudoalteromonas sp. MMG010]
MLNLWYKQFPKQPKDHKDFWRTRLIASLLLLMTVYFFILTALNVFYFASYDLAIIDATGLFLSLVVTLWFCKKATVNQASWAVVLLTVGLIMAFIISAKGYAHSLFWVTLIPPLAFFLVDRNSATLVCIVTSAICAYLVYQQYQQTVIISLGSLFNIIEVCIAHILMFRFYEKTHNSAYTYLSLRNVQIQNLADTDKLTGVYNRQKFDRSLSKLLSDIPQDTTHHILLCDIDYFKRINDQYGHLTGDKVLTEFAATLKTYFSSNVFIARWGGEEFTIVLSNTVESTALQQTLDFKEFINTQMFSDISLTISIGLTLINKDDTVLSILERADKALYEVKNNGRNAVCTIDKVGNTTIYKTKPV